MLDARPLLLPDFRTSASLDRRHVRLDRAVAEGVHRERIFSAVRPADELIDARGRQIEAAAVSRRVRVRLAHEAEPLDRRAIEDPLHAAHVHQSASAAAAAAVCCRVFRRWLTIGKRKYCQRIGVSAATSAFDGIDGGQIVAHQLRAGDAERARLDRRIAGSCATMSAASVLIATLPPREGLRVFIEASVQAGPARRGRTRRLRVLGACSSMPTKRERLAVEQRAMAGERRQPDGMIGRDRVEPRACERRVLPRLVARTHLRSGGPAGVVLICARIASAI